MNQLADGFDASGWTPDDVTKLRSTPGLLAEVKLVILGLATIVRTCFKLALNKAFDPELFFGKGWTIWKGPVEGNGLEGAEDCVSEPEVEDFEQIVMETHLQGEEPSIPGEEKMRRARASKTQQLAKKAALALWSNWVACRDAGKPKESTLEMLYKARKIGGVIYLFGMTLRSPDGGRCVLYLYRYSNGGWDLNCFWLSDRWDASSPSAALASVK